MTNRDDLPYKVNYRSKDDSPRNGMLTESHREFLEGDGSGLAESTQSERKTAIKERVYNTLLDFALLHEHWDKHDQEGREEIMGDSINDKAILEGLAGLVAMLYTDSPYGLQSGLEKVLLEGVNKAERELSESDWYYVADVDLEVDYLEEVEYKKAIRKFKRGKMSDMTDGEAQAIVRLLHRTPTVSPTELREMQHELMDHYDEILEEQDEAAETRANKAREKQMRLQERDEE
ncbi:hypothetical protein ACFQJ7_17030 [Halovenus rubra]|uniref:Domain of unknown function domain-containing protein n=2 Tax=Halovenus rubra TaxID=869890 RepID=A0ABD5XDK8_9EURY|nr:hypothetical protein [Halovenus rubra]